MICVETGLVQKDVAEILGQRLRSHIPERRRAPRDHPRQLSLRGDLQEPSIGECISTTEAVCEAGGTCDAQGIALVEEGGSATLQAGMRITKRTRYQNNLRKRFFSAHVEQHRLNRCCGLFSFEADTALVVQTDFGGSKHVTVVKKHDDVDHMWSVD